MRKAGGKGRSIRDDPSRYPDKEDVGILREPYPPPPFRNGFPGFLELGSMKPEISSVNVTSIALLIKLSLSMTCFPIKPNSNFLKINHMSVSMHSNQKQTSQRLLSIQRSITQYASKLTLILSPSLIFAENNAQR
jgi:hypothetical protein